MGSTVMNQMKIMFHVPVLQLDIDSCTRETETFLLRDQYIPSWGKE